MNPMIEDQVAFSRAGIACELQYRRGHFALTREATQVHPVVELRGREIAVLRLERRSSSGGIRDTGETEENEHNKLRKRIQLDH